MSSYKYQRTKGVKKPHQAKAVSAFPFSWGITLRVGGLDVVKGSVNIELERTSGAVAVSSLDKGEGENIPFPTVKACTGILTPYNGIQKTVCDLFKLNNKLKKNGETHLTYILRKFL